MASLLKSVARFVFFLFLFFFLFFVLLVGDRRSASSKSKAQLEEAPKADPGTVSACVLGVCAWGGEGTVTGGRQTGVSGASVAERGNRTGRFRRGISVQGLSRGLFNTSRLQNHRTVLIFHPISSTIYVATETRCLRACRSAVIAALLTSSLRQLLISCDAQNGSRK
jgi:hypothetical protein